MFGFNQLSEKQGYRKHWLLFVLCPFSALDFVYSNEKCSSDSKVFLKKSQRECHIQIVFNAMAQTVSLSSSVFQADSFAIVKYLRNEFDFWNVHGIMNTPGLLQSR